MLDIIQKHQASILYTISLKKSLKRSYLTGSSFQVTIKRKVLLALSRLFLSAGEYLQLLANRTEKSPLKFQYTTD